MALLHNVEISWDDLMTAFSSGTGDTVYYLDRLTGEIFSVSSAFEDDVWRHMESNNDRFLEIPAFDYSLERQVMNGFIGTIENSDLKTLLSGSLTGNRPYGNIHDILSFYPEEHEKLLELKDQYVTSRVKFWLEENELFTVESTGTLLPRT